jgi:hypothetical protein
MKTKSFVCALSPFALLVPLCAAAEPLPKPVAELERLVGVWKGGGTLAMGKDTAKLDASWSCKRTSARFGLLCTFQVTGIPGVASYDETDLIGYEPSSSTYHWYSVTNAGETHDHVAPLPKSDAFEFVFNGNQANQPLKEVIALGFAEGGKVLTGRAETFVAGTSASVMELRLRRRVAP